MYSVPVTELLAFASDLRGAAVLVKSHDLWANLERGGDWDLAVRNLSEAEASLRRHLGDPRRVERRSHLRACFYGWGEVDLLDGVRWRGLPILTSEQMLAEAVPADPFLRSRPAHEAVAAWIGPILAGGSWKVDRHGGALAEAWRADGPALRRLLRQLFGQRATEELESTIEGGRPMPRGLRRRFLARSVVRAPIKSLTSMAAFTQSEVRSRLRPSLPQVRVSSESDVELALAWCARQGRVVHGVVWCEGDGLVIGFYSDGAWTRRPSLQRLTLPSRLRLRLLQLRSRGFVALSPGRPHDQDMTPRRRA